MISIRAILVFMIYGLDHKINTCLPQNRYRITTEMFFSCLIFHLPVYSNFTKLNIPASRPGCGINGYILYLVFQSKHVLAATTLVTAVIAFITGAAAHHDVAAYIAGRCITLHTLCSSAH